MALRHEKNRKDLKWSRAEEGKQQGTSKDAKQYQGPTEVKKHESVTKAISAVLLIFKIV